MKLGQGLVLSYAIIALLVGGPIALAATSTDTGTKAEVDELQSAVKDKQNRIKELEDVISKYRQRINEQAGAQATLENQVALIENSIQEKELAIERVRGLIDIANLELQRVQLQIQNEELRLQRRKEALGGVLGELQDAQGVGLFESYVARGSLSEFFTQMEELKRLEYEMTNATLDVKEGRRILELKKEEVEAYRKDLEQDQVDLLAQQNQLEEERAAKASLLAETSAREEEFQRIMYELRQQRQEEASNAADLEMRIKDKLNQIDKALARGDVLFSWPFRVTRISAHFHDKTYPYRNLFEHPGTDLPAPVGTQVKAAAGGYVAFTRTGKQYGNYLMIVHPGGYATVYAHLSAFKVKADSYVERGDVIALSGGAAGAPGSGLSTGPHLHFELRKDGIPIDAEPYLPDL
ncbi:MAG TPA: peptidoglycan DD-metalloendopeptidase family protein [bacterium]|nr:peptidoglycan DD-metalloendopeptidase family protein [Candidatus Magasanikbacteria bacterium]MCA9389614.1 peptidoglycan DD-metalloendopeptidase family protein [Candidatus Magasanikbacteria bacterium]HPF95667.1 peptidoglycan DD-metalloendopeptidase family protein [bacterium]